MVEEEESSCCFHCCNPGIVVSRSSFILANLVDYRLSPVKPGDHCSVLEPVLGKEEDTLNPIEETNVLTDQPDYNFNDLKIADHDDLVLDIINNINATNHNNTLDVKQDWKKYQYVKISIRHSSRE